MAFPCSTYQWSPSTLIYSHIYIHVWRMCGFTSMIWHHLLYSLPPYQLLSPTDIQPLANDHSTQQASMQWLLSDTFTHMHSCVTFVSGRWSHHNPTMISHNPFHSHPALLLQSAIELQPNHLVEQHNTPIHASILLLRDGWMFLTRAAMMVSTNYA